MGRMGTRKRKADAVTGDPAFETWVARQLHKMYDEVLAEDLPADLLRVIDEVTGKAATPPATDPALPGHVPDAAAAARGKAGRRGS